MSTMDLEENIKSKLNISAPSSTSLNGGSNSNETALCSSSATESRLFQMVRPICVDIMKNPTSANLNQLTTILQDVPTDLVQSQLVEYIIFPINVHLKLVDKMKQEVQIATYQCLEVLLTKWRITNFTLFLELFHRFNIAFGTKSEPTKLNSQLPEDIIDPVLSCLSGLLKVSLSFHFDEIYTLKYVPSVGHCIFMALQIVTENTTVSVRMKALEVLNILISSCSGNIEAGQHIFRFLPGLASGLRKLCSLKVGRRHIKLISKAMQVLQMTVKISAFSGTQETLQLADFNLSTVFQQISDSLLNSDNEQIQYALMEFSIELSVPLTTKMPICCDIVWNNIFVLACSSNPKVSESCQKFILSSSSSSAATNSTCQFSPEIIINLTKRAVGQLKTNDESACLILLKRIASTLFLVQMSSDNLKLFLPSLIEIIKTFLITSTTNKSLEIEMELKNTRNLVREICGIICINLTFATDLTDILSVLSELVKNVSCSTELILTYESAAVIFVINNVIKACAEPKSTPGDDDDQDQDLFSLNANCIRRVLENNEVCATVTTYVELLNSSTQESSNTFQLISSNSSSLVKKKTEEINSATTPTAKFNLAHAVFDMYILEGLGILLTIEPELFQLYILPEMIYILLEHAGRTDFTFVANSALNALQNISPEKSIDEILSENLDLILNEISLKIKFTPNEFSPRCPDAIIFLAKYFDFSSQSGFVQFVEEIFFQSNLEFIEEQGSAQNLFAKLFYAVINSLWIHMQNMSNAQVGLEIEEATMGTVEPKSLLQKLLDYQRSVGMAVEETAVTEKEEEDGASGVEKEAEETQETTMEEEDKKLPANISLTLRICERAIHFLPLDLRDTKLLAMDILIKGIQMLKDYENSLLPLAHQIWDYLVPRFDEPDYVIVRKSFALLLALCTASKTFLKNRTLTEIFPKLASLLKKLAEESSKVKDKNRVYYTSTQAYKLQLCVLEGLADLCKAIEIQERDINNVADGCLLYLVPDQHKNLKEASKKLLKELSRTTYGSTIWMKLIAQGLVDDFSLITTKEPPHPSFKRIPLIISRIGTCSSFSTVHKK